MGLFTKKIAGYAVAWWLLQLAKALVWFSMLGFMARLGWRTAACVFPL